MKVLFDTSVLVAALLQSHQSHNVCSAWLVEAREQRLELVPSTHTLAELFAGLTAMPANRRIPTSDVWALIDESSLRRTLRTEFSVGRGAGHRPRLANAGIRGGSVYDAMIAEVARREEVDLLLTLNLSHFQRVWPEGADRIRSPHVVGPSDYPLT